MRNPDYASFSLFALTNVGCCPPSFREVVLSPYYRRRTLLLFFRELHSLAAGRRIANAVWLRKLLD